MRINSLIHMTEPSTANNTRPMYEEEVAHFGQLNLEDYSFNFGVYFTNKDDEVIPIPENVGRVVQQLKKGRDPVQGTTSYAIPCRDVFKKVNLKLTAESTIAKENGFCHESNTGYIEGVETFGEQTNAEVTFEHCWERPDSDPDKPVCLNR